MRRLTLGEWASIAEIVSAVAVVISLIYVGYQINQNTEEVRASNRQELVDRAVDVTRDYAINPQVAEVIAKARSGDELSPQEHAQYGYVIRSVLYDIQEAFLLHREGRLDEGYWATRNSLIVVYLSPEIAYEVYRLEKEQGILHPDYAQWIDEQ
jgi:hypothetical protein